MIVIPWSNEGSPWSYHGWGLLRSTRCLSVCLSVCQAGGLCKNGWADRRPGGTRNIVLTGVSIPAADSMQPSPNYFCCFFVFFAQLRSIPTCVSQDTPAPGSYDVVRAYHQSQDRCELRPPRTEAARRRHEAFLSSAERFLPPTDFVHGEPDVRLPGLTKLLYTVQCSVCMCLSVCLFAYNSETAVTSELSW